jgi:hypothetical protein
MVEKCEQLEFGQNRGGKMIFTWTRRKMIKAALTAVAVYCSLGDATGSALAQSACYITYTYDPCDSEGCGGGGGGGCFEDSGYYGWLDC